MISHASDSILLSLAERTALSHAEATARRGEDDARARVFACLARAGCTQTQYVEAMDCVMAHARIVIHFHPDRPGRKGATVAEALLDEGVYRNQFETGLSSGSVSAFPGGERDVWERTLFGGAYHEEGVIASHRPKYGALELVRYADGPIPRFGSCYLVLRQRITKHCSFTFMGSGHPQAKERLGTISHMFSAMAALLAEIEEGGMAAPAWPPFRAPTLGITQLTVSRLFDVLRALSQSRRDPLDLMAGRVLDTVIEAHVHAPIALSRDVELLVADPSFAPTATGEVLRRLAERYEIPLRWHHGFQLPVDDVPDDFRGPAMPRLAKRIAGDGMLDAAVIGRAAASLHADPNAWRDWGSHAEALQHLKQLWHVLVHYGMPATRL